MKRVGGVAAVAAAVTLLAGCGGGDTTNPSAPVTSSQATLGEVDSVVDLKDAAMAAGMSCPFWDQTNAMTLAAESGECTTGSGSYVLSTYISESSRDDAVQRFKDFSLGIRKTLEEKEDVDPALTQEETLLVGPNWVINSNTAASLQVTLGGKIVRF
jgi:hypothetical protein